MKRTLRLVGMAALVLLLAVSCKKEEKKTVENEEGLVMKTFGTGIAQNGDAKTGLVPGTDGNRFNQKWFNSDKITVSSVAGESATTQTFDFESFTSQDESTATFTGLVKPDAQTYYAFYPAANDNGPVKSSYNEGTKTVTFTLPGTQTYVENSYATDFAPMVATATSDDERLMFDNLCGLFEFRVFTDQDFECTLTEVQLDALAPAEGTAPSICGSYQYTFGEEGGLKPASSKGATNQIILNCGNLPVSHSSVNPTSFIFVIPPTRFEHGFSLTYRGTIGGLNTIFVDNRFANKDLTVGAGGALFNNDPYEISPEFKVGIMDAITTGVPANTIRCYISSNVKDNVTDWVEVAEQGVLIYQGETVPDPATAVQGTTKYVLTGEHAQDCPLSSTNGIIDAYNETFHAPALMGAENKFNVKAYAKYRYKGSSESTWKWVVSGASKQVKFTM